LLPCTMESCLLSGSKGRKMLSHDVKPPKANITLHDAHPADLLSFPCGCQLFATMHNGVMFAFGL
jgi:hypothetical protein